MDIRAVSHAHLMGYIIAAICLGYIANCLFQIVSLKKREILLLDAITILKGEEIPERKKKKAKKNSSKADKASKKVPKADSSESNEEDVPLQAQLYPETVFDDEDDRDDSDLF